jgi:hypothetical protein
MLKEEAGAWLTTLKADGATSEPNEVVCTWPMGWVLEEGGCGMRAEDGWRLKAGMGGWDGAEEAATEV